MTTLRCPHCGAVNDGTMTANEFQRRYHDYRTHDEETAKQEAEKANHEGIDGDEAVAVRFGALGWGLMLKSAAQFIGLLGG